MEFFICYLTKLEYDYFLVLWFTNLGSSVTVDLRTNGFADLFLLLPLYSVATTFKLANRLASLLIYIVIGSSSKI